MFVCQKASQARLPKFPHLLLSAVCSLAALTRLHCRRACCFQDGYLQDVHV